MPVGSNLELQVQQLAIGAIVSVYVIIFRGIVYGLGTNTHINFVLAEQITEACGLALFCFGTAHVFVYTPRIALALKINLPLAFMALTQYPPSRRFDVRPLPGIVEAQLIGAAISTFVNIFVFPSTASRDLMGSFRRLLDQMVQCCEYFETTAAGLGVEHRRGSREAARLRVNVRQAVEKFGQIVGGSRYETNIERFSQIDYHCIFLDSTRLASSFGSMCLPFEIDDSFYYQLEDPAAQMKHGRMATGTAGESRVSMESFMSEHHSTDHQRRRNAAIDEATLMEAANMHRQREVRIQGMHSAVAPACAQLWLHRRVLQLVWERTDEFERRSPTKSLIRMVTRTLRTVYRRSEKGPALHEFVAETPVALGTDHLPLAGDERQQLDDRLAQMSLAQMADIVDEHVELFQQTEAEFIALMDPLSGLDDTRTRENYVVLLSFLGAIRENAICLTALLRTVHQINEKRPDYVQVWFPRLSWSWLYHGHIDAEDGNEEDPVSDDWDLENAFDTEGEHINEPVVSFDGDTPALRSPDWGTQEPVTELSPSPRPLRRQRTEAKALYTQIDNRYARAARTVVDWLQRRKTQYAIKFTLTIMAWGIWAFIGVSARFFSKQNGSWGLNCIAAVFGVTIGSTFNAGFNRVLGSSLSGAWGIVAWRSSSNGQNPYLPCLCCIVYFIVAFYVGFFVPKWTAVSPVMVISFSSVLFPAYTESRPSNGAALGWKHAAVNAVAIVFTFAVSAIFMPYKARTALRMRLADLFRLNSFVVQSINHMHVARAEFQSVHKNELRRVRDFVSRSRIQLAKCRSLIPSAIREPSVHEHFQVDAHNLLINTLELQLEWLLYSFFTLNTRHSEVLHQMIRLALATREDIIGSKAVFNTILASSLVGNKRLPAYLPEMGTARLQFSQEVHPMLNEQYTKSFDITYLCRWKVGIWHLIATQSDLVVAVRTIVGAETDEWPEEVGFMLDILESDTLGNHPKCQQDVLHKPLRGQWFSRLPKYAAVPGMVSATN
ncbi:hypothetical protein GGF46_005431 [Coemansia sp. RSA 552]|nr:hypothetical protein GGF46_005431 [Coemansia sp. RSA 552]